MYTRIASVQLNYWDLDTFLAWAIIFMFSVIMSGELGGREVGDGMREG